VNCASRFVQRLAGSIGLSADLSRLHDDSAMVFDSTSGWIASYAHRMIFRYDYEALFPTRTPDNGSSPSQSAEMPPSATGEAVFDLRVVAISCAFSSIPIDLWQAQQEWINAGFEYFAPRNLLLQYTRYVSAEQCRTALIPIDILPRESLQLPKRQKVCAQSLGFGPSYMVLGR
jgi:hypothetical protein